MFIYNSIPTVVVQDNVSTPQECEYLINLAKTIGLQKNKVNQNGTQILDEKRTSEGVFIPYGSDQTLDEIVERLSAIARVPSSKAEPITIQRYTVGQEYKPHWDAWPTDVKVEQPPELEDAGNRSVTLLLYLNDSDGGSTGFPNLGFVVQAMQGRILMFGNLDENKEPHPLSLHMGMSPESGEALKAKEPKKEKAKKQKPLQEQMAEICRGENQKYHV
jgi:prolyl 4-hydroxylase